MVWRDRPSGAAVAAVAEGLAQPGPTVLQPLLRQAGSVAQWCAFAGDTGRCRSPRAAAAARGRRQGSGQRVMPMRRRRLVRISAVAPQMMCPSCRISLISRGSTGVLDPALAVCRRNRAGSRMDTLNSSATSFGCAVGWAVRGARRNARHAGAEPMVSRQPREPSGLHRFRRQGSSRGRLAERGGGGNGVAGIGAGPLGKADSAGGRWLSPWVRRVNSIGRRAHLHAPSGLTASTTSRRGAAAGRRVRPGSSRPQGRLRQRQGIPSQGLRIEEIMIGAAGPMGSMSIMMRSSFAFAHLVRALNFSDAWGGNP